MANTWRYVDSLHLVVISSDGCQSGQVDSDEILGYIAEGGIIDPEPHPVFSPEQLRELAAFRLRCRKMLQSAQAEAAVRHLALAACKTEGRA
jgi:hypothetical protein